MWFFARDPTKDFAYEIGDIIPTEDERSIWTLHRGKRKANGEPVTIFRFESRPGYEQYFDRAKNAVKRLKTLRHPCILTYLDSLETEKAIYVVTESVEPLQLYLSNLKSEGSEAERQFAISWGLHQICRGLEFMINDCNLCHNNLHSNSVFVNQAGTWRIAGLEYVCSANDEDSTIMIRLPSLKRYLPPELDQDQHRRSGGPKYAVDSWGLGIVIWEAFNGLLDTTNSLKAQRNIPEALSPHYKRLIAQSPSQRISPSDLVTKCRAANGYFKNTFIDAMLFLEEIQIKESGEKNRFFTNLDNHLESFPKSVCKNKILPQLVNAYEFGNAGSAILGPLFKIGKWLDHDEYQKKIVPCVIKLFACKDRATRAKLLQQMELFVDHLQPKVINDELFMHIAQGFVDSNPTIREQTVKCMLYLAPKLNYANLNEEMLKHFARLQAKDEEGGIRTNTTICLGKVAHHLHPQIRQTMLIPAFLRAMRDPFPPARISAILALCATQNFYSLRECATRVMPALCHLTMDPEKSVRDQAFKALKGVISKLEKVSEEPSLAEQMEADLNAAGSSASNSLSTSWASWAVGSLTAKFYRSKSTTSAGAPATTAPPAITPSAASVPASNSTIPSAASSLPLSQNAANRAESFGKTLSQESVTDFDENAWGSMDEEADSRPEKPSHATKTHRESLDGWDDENWEGFAEDESTHSEGSRLSSKETKGSLSAPRSGVLNYDTNSKSRHSSGGSSSTAASSKSKKNPDDFFSEWEPQEGAKNAYRSQHPSASLSDTLSQPSYEQKPSTTLRTNASSVSKDLEERRLQRMKENEERRAKQGAVRGPMKLGARKLT